MHVTAERHTSPAATVLREALAAHYVARYGAHDLAEDDPAGTTLVGWHGQTAVAMIAVIPTGDPTRAELRRAYVAPEHRGHGWGQRMLTAAIEHARAAGYSTATGTTSHDSGVPQILAALGLSYGPTTPRRPHDAAPGFTTYAVTLFSPGGRMNEQTPYLRLPLDDAPLITQAVRERAASLRATVASPTQAPSAVMFGHVGSAAMVELVEAGRRSLTARAEQLDDLAERIDAHAEDLATS